MFKKINNFEDLVIWQLARLLVRDVYTQFKTCKDYDFNSQIHRAAVSIMNNIAEGFERSKFSKDNKQMLSFINISYGSCGEVRSMLYTAEDLGYLDSKTAKSLRDRTTDLSFKMEAFIAKLKEHDTNTKLATAKLTNSEAHQQRSSPTRSQQHEVNNTK